MRKELVKETGFNEVFDTQRCFRVLADGMSRPGRVFRLRRHDFSGAPQGFNPNMLTILKTLGDNTVGFSTGNYQNETIRGYVELNTGMPPAEVTHANYILFRGMEFDRSFYAAREGSLEFPEDSATVIVSVERLLDGGGPEDGSAWSDCCPGNSLELRLTGPGIKEVNRVAVTGLDPEYIGVLAEKNAIFPLGIDMIVVDEEGNVICIPRTTRVEVA